MMSLVSEELLCKTQVLIKMGREMHRANAHPCERSPAMNIALDSFGDRAGPARATA